MCAFLKHSTPVTAESVMAHMAHAYQCMPRLKQETARCVKMAMTAAEMTRETAATIRFTYSSTLLGEKE